jgi:predicted lipase
MDIIKKCAKYAVSSYDNTYLYKSNVTNNKPANEIKEITKFNVFVRIHKYDDEVFISIRGTDELSDWLNNMRRWKTNFVSNSKVHKGFLEHLNYVYDDIYKEIKNYKKINIIGHSLGGAVSVLLGTKLCFLDNSINCNIVTYGSPRVGDRKFKNLCSMLFNLKCYRVYNSYDVVTKVPYFGFHHVGLKCKVKSAVPFYSVKKTHSMLTYFKGLL